MDEILTPASFELPESLAARVKSELRPGERLLWAVEVSDDAMNPVALVVIGLGVLTAVVVFVAASRWIRDGEVQRDLQSLGVIFTFIGLFCLAFARRGYRNRRRLEAGGLRPTYALTDRRIILWNYRGFYGLAGSFEVRSLERESIRTIHRIEYGTASGDIVINRTEAGENIRNDGRLRGIADVRRVEDLIRRAPIASPTDRTEAEA